MVKILDLISVTIMMRCTSIVCLNKSHSMKELNHTRNRTSGVISFDNQFNTENEWYPRVSPHYRKRIIVSFFRYLSSVILIKIENPGHYLLQQLVRRSTKSFSTYYHDKSDIFI